MTTVDKTIKLFGMSMEIAIKPESLKVMQNKSFGLVDRGVQFFLGLLPTAIQITPSQ